MQRLEQRKSKVQSWYLDMTMVRKYWGQERVYHHTAPINMLYGLHEATRLALDQLPGVQVALVGPDLSYTRGEGSGTIALGEARRGASLLWASVFIGVFVVFARIRPFWQVVLMAIAAGPIALFCNFLRAFTWGAATIYGHAPPLSSMPRNVSAVVSLLAAYGAFALCCAALGRCVSSGSGRDDVGGNGDTDAPVEGSQ